MSRSEKISQPDCKVVDIAQACRERASEERRFLESQKPVSEEQPPTERIFDEYNYTKIGRAFVEERFSFNKHPTLFYAGSHFIRLCKKP
jgi:hypothetical protein